MPGGGNGEIETVQDLKRGKVLIHVTDEGSGLDRDGQGSIFLPFYSTKKGKSGNLGLGLSVSYGIIKKYGGTITAGNLPQQGCIFTIELPAEDSDQN